MPIEKNRLTAADALRVEEAFRARLASLASPAGETAEIAGPTASPPKFPDKDAGWPKYRTQAEVINKSLLALPEPRRVRDRIHLKSVAKQPCLICGRRPADAHHLRYAQHRALGRKVGDEFTVPCAAVIIARSTAVAMKLHGGEKLGLIRHSQRACCGSKVTR